MSFWHSINGMVELRITSADTAGTLSALHDAGVTVFHGEVVDELTIRVQVRRQERGRVSAIAEKRGDSVELTRRMGLYWMGKQLLHRKVLTIGILFFLISAAYLPSRILFIQVEGNSGVPTRLILEKAAQCGIAFGASRREVRSEKMKNALLEAMPELQWAGVNTQGCVATITVREREVTQQTKPTPGVSSLVAVRDGVILSCTVTSGSAVCKVGQAVKTGEVLISGYTDCGLTIRAGSAQGEVYASTERKLSVVTPSSCTMRGETTAQAKKYALLFGKKRINLYKGSGILDTACDRIYMEKYLTLPGGFVLPVALVTEVWIYAAQEEVPVEQEDAAALVSGFASEYLKSQMIAGQILSAGENVEAEDGIYCLQGIYACREMIGRVQQEETLTPYGNTK